MFHELFKVRFYIKKEKRKKEKKAIGWVRCKVTQWRLNIEKMICSNFKNAGEVNCFRTGRQ